MLISWTKRYCNIKERKTSTRLTIDFFVKLLSLLQIPLSNLFFFPLPLFRNLFGDGSSRKLWQALFYFPISHFIHPVGYWGQNALACTGQENRDMAFDGRFLFQSHFLRLYERSLFWMVHKSLPTRQRSSLPPCRVQTHSAPSRQDAGTRRTLDKTPSNWMHNVFLSTNCPWTGCNQDDSNVSKEYTVDQAVHLNAGEISVSVTWIFLLHLYSDLSPNISMQGTCDTVCIVYDCVCILSSSYLPAWR